MCTENPRHSLFAGLFACICVTLFPPFFTASATAQNTQFKCRTEEEKILALHGKNEQQIHCGPLFVVPETAIIQ